MKSSSLLRPGRRLAYGVALSAVFAVAGCAVAPTTVRPVAPVAAAYPSQADQAAAPAAVAAADLGWRDVFRDPVLQQLIATSLDANRDLRVAALNVEAARAQYRIRRADSLPRIDGVAAGVSQRTPADLSPTGQSEVTRAYEAGGAVTAWELDLWGRVRSLNDQALATWLALDETRTAAQLSLVSEVATAYFTLRTDQALLELARDTAEAQRRSHELTQLLAEVGEAGELDVRRTEIALRSAEADQAVYERQAAQDLNALTLLIGQPLDADLARTLQAWAGEPLPDDVVEANLPAGLPSDLLDRRPDIRAAEQMLRGADANIGAARAAFFPTITLTGSAGSASSDLDNLFSAGTRSWSFAPRLSLPIFNGGALSANLDLAKVRQRIEVARYERAVQAGFREVADGLAARDALERQILSEQQRVDASRRAYDLAQRRHQEGEDSSLSVLDAQRTLYGSEQALLRARLARLSNLTTLYKALGGGWTEQTQTGGRT